MNKRDFAKAYLQNKAQKIGVNNALKEIEEILHMIKLELKEGEKIKFTNFCTMHIFDRAERRIANPNTMEPMTIKPPKKVKFALSTNMLKEFNP